MISWPPKSTRSSCPARTSRERRRRRGHACLALILFACADPTPRPARDDGWAAARERMVRDQLVAREVRDPRLLAAMGEVPRHEFVPESERRFAYEDRPLPIGGGQTISQPYVVALMTELLALRGGERVLEIGTGSGYQAAVLSRLAASVYSIEIDPALAASAAERLRRLGCANVRVKSGDGFFGWPDAAPFDAIIVTASPPAIPPKLVEQLAENGRIVVPVEREGRQELELGIKRGGRLEIEHQGGVMFVPMTGEIERKPDSR